jgi:Tfp pilus assembly PilM family ATPase
MRWARGKLLVALDAGSATGAVVSWGLGGPSVGTVSRVPLEAGALAPSPLEPNVVRPESVREALASVRNALGTNGRRVVLVLPHGVSRTLLVDTPPGVAIHDYARFRLSQGLTYPHSEAVVDSMPLGGRRHLCAAVRRSLVEAYESIAQSAGFALDRVDLAPLAAVAGLRSQASAADSGVALILGDTAYSLIAFRAGSVDAFRSRIRDPAPGEAERLSDEAVRTASLAGAGALKRVVVLGSGAPAVARRLRDLGCPAEPAWSAGDAGLPLERAELAWLGAALG